MKHNHRAEALEVWAQKSKTSEMTIQRILLSRIL
jgi:hypothetical protein